MDIQMFVLYAWFGISSLALIFLAASRRSKINECESGKRRLLKSMSNLLDSKERVIYQQRAALEHEARLREEILKKLEDFQNDKES